MNVQAVALKQPLEDLPFNLKNFRSGEVWLYGNSGEFVERLDLSKEQSRSDFYTEID
jgi:hypothetical protein